MDLIADGQIGRVQGLVAPADDGGRGQCHDNVTAVGVVDSNRSR